MLAAADISFAYTPARPVLRAVSLTLEPGTVTAILGPNGAGKSTLLRLMAGLMPPASGSILLAGESILGMDHKRRARRLAYVPQRTSLAFSFTTRQFVALGRYASGAGGDGDDHRAIDAALAATDLTDRRDEPFDTLSAGQQQRASLARALAQIDLPKSGAQALLLDEPLAALDPRHALRAIRTLRGLAGRGLAIGVILHDLHHASLAADCAAVLGADGTLAASGLTRDVLLPSVLEPVFAVRFEVIATAAGPAPLVIGDGR